MKELMLKADFSKMQCYCIVTRDNLPKEFNKLETLIKGDYLRVESLRLGARYNTRAMRLNHRLLEFKRIFKEFHKDYKDIFFLHNRFKHLLDFFFREYKKSPLMFIRHIIINKVERPKNPFHKKSDYYYEINMDNVLISYLLVIDVKRLNNYFEDIKKFLLFLNSETNINKQLKDERLKELMFVCRVAFQEGIKKRNDKNAI